jgi:diguanylate cyclase (GGDEF)-like protein
MRIAKIIGYTFTVALFAAFVDLFAWLQLTYILHIDLHLRYFIVPSVVGSVFGTILVLYRHYYQLAQERAYYEKIAKVDTLTGTMSRYACDLILEHESKRHGRNGKPFSLAMFDIDDFKSINDRFGHQEGDRVLKTLCLCVLEHLRDADTLCRWGGEEFIMILPETTAAEIAEVTERIRNAVATHDFGLDATVTISIGVITSSTRSHDVEALIYKADNALYRAKNGGKNRVVTVND